jgi:hypothetical protein
MVVCVMAAAFVRIASGQPAAQPPFDDPVIWDLNRAWRETTLTRERVCLNGLWRWQPAAEMPDAVPAEGWGHFKVPGSWPGITDYLQKDSQNVFRHSSWKDRNLGKVSGAWYQREITIPQDWQGRRVALSVEYLNSFAVVYVDGKKAGELRFPAGELDLSAVCHPGQKHVLSLLVLALPLKGVMLSYSDTASAKEVKGAVARRGLCGDVYLLAKPAAARLGNVKVDTSVRRGEVTVNATTQGLAADGRYTLRARIKDGDRTIREFASGPFRAGDLVDGHVTFSDRWKPDRLWDLHTPGNSHELEVSLVDADGHDLDVGWPVRFGFRELWIDGRDFYLNGTRIFLSALPLDNAQIGAASANYQAARQTLERLKRIGINCVYTHNYDCTPGAHLSFEEILRAADDVGVLVALSQPHFSQYDWKAPDADAHNGYARDAAFYVRVAQNHPSVVFYSTSHNATGYDEDMNPDQIDGVHNPRDTWSANNAKLALRAESIIRRLDPTRIVYHHAGGNIGSMYTINFYPNFAPVQELSDWFGHWARAGAKPLFLCEYGAPFTWDWTMYRGWYKGKREFGSAAVPWEFCLAEWDAQFLGDRAFASGEAEKADLRWEAKQFREGRLWHRWDYPTPVGSESFEGRNEVLATYLTDNWRAFRTWGVSGISPWEYEIYWQARRGVDRGRKELKVDWADLQRPGLSPDYVDHPLERIDTAFQEADWVPTAAGKALLRNNQPVLAYIAGKAGAFTGKDHNFYAGETVEKQLVIINNSRRELTFDCKWSLGLPSPVTSQTRVTVQTGEISFTPLRFDLPAGLAPRTYELRATTQFGEGEEQSDIFAIDVMPAAPAVTLKSEVAIFDPVGDTSTYLREGGIGFRRVTASDQFSPGEILIVGKRALTLEGPAPDLSRVRDGLRVIVFEQPSDVLEKRLGFRTAEYGLRQVFKRIPDHPVLAGLAPEHLRDWRGEATTLPPRLNYQLVPQHGPTVKWCDIPVSRVWRCGNRGNVASALIEKPARGDFRPILDGGYSLQYSPLTEYREGKGVVLFCQLDVTGRTDPAARKIVANLLRYASTWKPEPARKALYAGDPAGKQYLESAGVDAGQYSGGELSPEQHVLIVGLGGGKNLAPAAAALARFLNGGGRLLALAVDQRDVDAILPFKVGLQFAEHVNAVFDPPGMSSPLAGIGAADVYNRGPREFLLVSSDATIFGDGVLAVAPAGGRQPNVGICQFVPWQFDYRREYNLKRTYRRSSFLVTRLLANLGVAGSTPLLDHFHTPLTDARPEKRWSSGVYLDEPQEWDDPYRFFRW